MHIHRCNVFSFFSQTDYYCFAKPGVHVTPSADAVTPSADDGSPPAGAVTPPAAAVTPSAADVTPPAAGGPPALVRASESARCGASRYSLLGRCHRRRGAGTLCLSDSWCRSGRCRLGLCQRGTGDCRSGRPACGAGQQCAQGAASWSCRAADASLPQGAACSLHAECASGTCSAESGTCACPEGFTACAGHCYRPVAYFQTFSEAVVRICSYVRV